MRITACGTYVEAFSQLASASIADLYAVARLILRDTPRAEDAVQDALSWAAHAQPEESSSR